MKNVLPRLRIGMLALVAAVVSFYPAATVAKAAASVYSWLTAPQPAGQFAGTLTLTNLLPLIFSGMDTVSRERAGLIRAVGRDSGAERVALNGTFRSPVVGPMVAEDLTPAATAADTPNQTINYVDMTIQKARSVPFGITGEENRALNLAGTTGIVNRDRIAQALRTLSNEVEQDLGALHVSASRAYGTATGTPFGTAGDMSDFAEALRIMEANGAPPSDLHMVLGETSTARLRGKMHNLFKVNEAGSDDLLREGRMGRLQSFDMHTSPGIRAAVTVGTVTATVNATGYAVGSTSFGLSAAASALVAGDIITFAGDTNQYVVKTAITSGSGGTLEIQEPGIKVAMSAATKAITVVAATTRNMFFYRGAIQLATRAPAMPDGGDSADDVMMVTDPVTGIAYEFAVYRQKRQVRYEVNLAWGVKAVQPRHIGLLIGA